MPALRTSLDLIRNLGSSQSVRGPRFWITTALIALLLPSPLAAPLILARLRRPHEE